MRQRIDDRDVGARQQGEVMVGLDVRRLHETDLARVDDDEPGALAQAALHLRGEHRVRLRRVGADDDDDVGIHDAVERLRAGRRAERLLEPVTRRRVADARAGIDIVVAEGRAHQLLHDEDFLVGAARRGDAADRLAAVLLLDFPEAPRRVFDRFVPAYLAPRLVDRVADQRAHYPVAVGRIAPGEASLDAAVAVVGLAVLVGRHAHDLVALHLGDERAADAAVRTGCLDGALGLAVFDDALLHERCGRAGLHAGAAGYALGVEEILADAGRYLGLEAAALDRQRKRALDLVAGAHAARADDALAGIELEVGVAGVDTGVEVIGAVETVAHLAQADGAGHVLQFAVAVGRAGQAVERVIGNVEFHDIAPQPGEIAGLRANLHAVFDGRRARGRVALAALDLDQAQAAGAERLQAVGRAELGNVDARLPGGAHDAGAGAHSSGQAVYLDPDGVRAGGCRRAEILLSDPVHSSTPTADAKSSA